MRIFFAFVLAAAVAAVFLLNSLSLLNRTAADNAFAQAARIEADGRARATIIEAQGQARLDSAQALAITTAAMLPWLVTLVVAGLLVALTLTLLHLRTAPPPTRFYLPADFIDFYQLSAKSVKSVDQTADYADFTDFYFLPAKSANRNHFIK